MGMGSRRTEMRSNNWTRDSDRIERTVRWIGEFGLARPGGSHSGGGHMEQSGPQGRVATGPRPAGVKGRSARGLEREMPEQHKGNV